MWWFFLAGIVAGTILGAVACGFLLHWLQSAREKRALQALVTHVHLKRALAEGGPGVIEPDHDAARCRSAVADVRQQVRDTLSELRPGSSSPTAVLLEMHRACDAYLRETDRNGRNYEARLRVLRPVLNEGARRLSGARHVQYLAPGQREAARGTALPAARPEPGGDRSWTRGEGRAEARTDARHKSERRMPQRIP
ncbi:hypothetical protein J2M53_14100 [Arthrobacter sp. zg-ZUI100]|uniref:hypothetical protein n=1 Tax=Arthrobacter jiangjiafuii TaxID=2817475 RepID=UPI001AEEAEDA|nr:hypothetical protein [Arthrobacter jiangjiafuii]MBP3037377.1 hypothetical protein [Arthrobacter jiangjiafuii]